MSLHKSSKHDDQYVPHLNSYNDLMLASCTKSEKVKTATGKSWRVTWSWHDTHGALSAWSIMNPNDIKQPPLFWKHSKNGANTIPVKNRVAGFLLFAIQFFICSLIKEIHIKHWLLHRIEPSWRTALLIVLLQAFDIIVPTKRNKFQSCSIRPFTACSKPRSAMANCVSDVIWWYLRDISRQFWLKVSYDHNKTKIYTNKEKNEAF